MMFRIFILYIRGPPRGLGNRGIRPFISGKQGNKSLKRKATGEQRQYWGTGNIENQDFDFGERGKMPIFFRRTREQMRPLPPPSPWEGLYSEPSLQRQYLFPKTLNLLLYRRLNEQINM